MLITYPAKVCFSNAANNPSDCRMHTPYFIFYAATFVSDCLTKKIYNERVSIIIKGRKANERKN